MKNTILFHFVDRTIWEGIQKLATERGHNAVFVLGDSHYGPVDVHIAVEQAKSADYVVLVLGEYAYSEMTYPITQLYILRGFSFLHYCYSVDVLFCFFGTQGFGSSSIGFCKSNCSSCQTRDFGSRSSKTSTLYIDY